MMKILVVTREKRSRPFDTLFNGIGHALGSVEIIYLSQEDTYRVGDVICGTDLTSFDRVLLDVPMRKLEQHIPVLSSIRGLFIYEEDTWQEFNRFSKARGKFSRIMSKLPNASLIVTGYKMERFFRTIGVRVFCAPKAADDSYLWDERRERDIELAFIGTVKNKIYKKRNKYIAAIEKSHGLQVLQTDPTDEYRETLNRIRLFFSADVDFGEYMAKNFEAMLCGCVLIAARQNTEEDALGFRDMENIILYDSIKEARRKIDLLRGNPALVERIGNAGRELVFEKHLLRHRIDVFSKALTGEGSA